MVVCLLININSETHKLKMHTQCHMNKYSHIKLLDQIINILEFMNGYDLYGYSAV